MLDQLTNYLLRHHRVSLPGLGTLELVQQPATLDIANKLIYPPYYKTLYSQKQEVPEHQLQFLQMVSGSEGQLSHQLQAIGEAIKEQLHRQPFTWKGIGTFELQAGQIQFHPEDLPSPLQPVPANKVLREHVQHSVLVGDHMVLSDGSAEPALEARRGRDFTTTLGWIIVILAAAFVLFHLYQHQFAPGATGLGTKMEQKAAPPSYK